MRCSGGLKAIYDQKSGDESSPVELKRCRALEKIQVFMNIASEVSKLSRANRKKVGAIILRDSRIIATGYNGTPPGYDNSCEDMNGQTLDIVYHAEFNAICQLTRMGISSLDSEIYVTMSPCLECAKLILNSGIKTVFYKEVYRDLSGVEFLKKNNIKCYRVN